MASKSEGGSDGRRHDGTRCAGSRRARLGETSPDARCNLHVRSREENELPLVSGGAWKDFCRNLEFAGQTILAAEGCDDPDVRAAEFRYLLGLVKVGIQQATELDPEQPRFIRICDSDSKAWTENADNAYALPTSAATSPIGFGA